MDKIPKVIWSILYTLVLEVLLAITILVKITAGCENW
jgi:hypothetical protein